MTQMPLPVSGRSPQARRSSYSGATFAQEGRQRLIARYLALLSERGPHSDVEAAKALGIPECVSSICSLRNALVERELVEASGEYEHVSWPGRKKETLRTRWRAK